MTDGDDPPWLDDREQMAWMALMPILLILPAKLDAQLRQDSQLRLYEYLVLAALSEQPSHTIGMKSLSGMTNGSMSRLSHVVSRLENRGWVTRRPHPDDGRLTEAQLTDDGYQQVVDTAPGHVRAARALVIDLLTPTQIEQLRDICTSIAGRLVDEDVLPPGRKP